MVTSRLVECEQGLRNKIGKRALRGSTRNEGQRHNGRKRKQTNKCALDLPASSLSLCGASLILTKICQCDRNSTLVRKRARSTGVPGTSAQFCGELLNRHSSHVKQEPFAGKSELFGAVP